MQAHGPNGVLDITPTWSGLLQPLLWMYKNGDHEQRNLAMKELMRMANIADKHVATNTNTQEN